ncbi:right-handed parallel beta-helix repeat-containing protein [Sphingopyxis sp. PET50]|uniref:right-handed parallel beta-helix repeat-containing protein n=1 Tax=Sphingopyxis sp. PET50 TaxID=2976533 RepID=UPI0021B00F15|nr:right-handed parallel beta-helix repeat-containing protein [Sphingopyxis sp. PET50]
MNILLYAVALAAGAIGFAAPASAQATRTWVSGVGDDANPCSRTAPCRTFAGAISKTAAGGEINCLDPGSFGAVTVTKSISIICEKTIGGILVASGTGIVIQAAPTDVVLLSGLDFEGLGSGLNGVDVVRAGSVIIRNSGFRGFQVRAIFFRPQNAGASLTVENASISGGTVSGGSNNGIAVSSGSSTNSSASFWIDNVRFSDNLSIGLSIGASAGSQVKGSVSNSLFADTGIAIYAAPSTDSSVQLTVKDSVISGGVNGILAANGAGVQVGGTTITQNSGTGVLTSNGAAILTYGDNVVTGNGTDGSFTGTVLKK